MNKTDLTKKNMLLLVVITVIITISSFINLGRYTNLMSKLNSTETIQLMNVSEISNKSFGSSCININLYNTTTSILPTGPKILDIAITERIIKRAPETPRFIYFNTVSVHDHNRELLSSHPLLDVSNSYCYSFLQNTGEQKQNSLVDFKVPVKIDNESPDAILPKYFTSTSIIYNSINIYTPNDEPEIRYIRLVYPNTAIVTFSTGTSASYFDSS